MPEAKVHCPSTQSPWNTNSSFKVWQWRKFLKDTFVRLDLTLSGATLPPLLLEINRRVSLLSLCFNGCFNALRLAIMSSWWCLDETIDQKMGSAVLVVMCPLTNCKTPKMIFQDLIHSNYSLASSSYCYTWFYLVILRSICSFITACRAQNPILHVADLICLLKKLVLKCSQFYTCSHYFLLKNMFAIF